MYSKSFRGKVEEVSNEEKVYYNDEKSSRVFQTTRSTSTSSRESAQNSEGSGTQSSVVPTRYVYASTTPATHDLSRTKLDSSQKEASTLPRADIVSNDKFISGSIQQQREHRNGNIIPAAPVEERSNLNSQYEPKELEAHEPREDDEQFSDYQPTENSLAPNGPHDDPNHKIIAQICEDVLQNCLTDGENTSARNPSGPPPNSTEGSQPNKRQDKRKASSLEDYYSANSIAQSSTAGKPSTNTAKKVKFACLFWKMNQHVYASCGHTGFGQVCHLADHLRKEHALKQHSCQTCWRPFVSAEDLLAHNTGVSDNTCRETRGIRPETLKISKRHTGDYNKWFWIWGQLFPLFQKPKSPYWEPFDHDAQLFSNLRQFMSTQLAPILPAENLETVMGTLTRFRENWVTNPPEPQNFAPFPTPAATQASNDDRQSVSQGIGAGQEERTPLSTGYLSSLTIPNNAYDIGMSQELTENDTDVTTQNHSLNEDSLVLNFDFDALVDSQTYDPSFQIDVQDFGFKELDNLIDQFDWPTGDT
ncbi:hypothetical protein F4804DRAFT_348330 [Jackrogersella minutella]|nr:hypothetical protein F4804DRAFT_348330 [Jackrogersella minutella]